MYSMSAVCLDARTAARAALRAVALDLDDCALAGAVRGTMHQRVSALAATAGLLLAVRAILRL